MDWKKIGKRLLFPPVWLMALLSAVCAGLLIWIFVSGKEQSFLAYGAYALSFYTLSAVTLFCILILPKKAGICKEKLHANPWIHRYLTDQVFRGRLSMYVSLAVSLAYVAVNLLMWRLNRSWWFLVLAVYYLILSLMRFLLVRYVRKNSIATNPVPEWQRSRSCAWILLAVNLTLSALVLMILYQSKGYHYPGILIYVVALYTFYALIHTLVDLFKYRRLGSPVMSTAKLVSLSAALVSMLNLETAMFSAFGQNMPLQEQRLMIMLTGAGVSIVIVTLSVWLIVRANQEIRSSHHGKPKS